MQTILKILLTSLGITLVIGLSWVAAETDSPEPSVPANTASGSKNIKYVSDKLVIMLRSGPSGNHKIVRSLSSGTYLEVLDTQDEYARVMTDNGTEGWVLNQYLIDEPIARQQLTSAKKEIAVLEAQSAQFKREMEQAKNELITLRKEHRKISDTNQTLQSENNQIRDLAEKPMELSTQNNKLSQKTITLESEVALLQQELQMLRDASDKQWFLTGAGVALAGIMLGVMLSRMRRVRKSDWGNSLNRF